MASPLEVSMVEDDDEQQRDQVDDRLPLSDDEQRVLELYDQLRQLTLEIAILNAQSAHRTIPSDNPDHVSEQTRHDLLESRANYRLRQDVIDTVMTVNPILKAVHTGTNALPAERDLLPYIERRDQSAISVAQQSTSVGFIRNDLTEVQSDTARVIRKNVELTTTLLDLAAQVKQKQASRVDDDATLGEIARLEAAMKSSRQRWRVIKGVASGVVAGSGVDWARDARLKEVVLDLDGND